MINNNLLIIAGVNKAGTSSLFSYLNECNTFQGSKIKETCYFLPLRYDKKISNTKYSSFFNNTSFKNQYYLESTPGYFYGGKKIASFIKKNYPKTKIVIILRNPLERTESFIRHCINRTWIDKKLDVDKTINEIIDSLVKSNNISYNINEKDYLKRAIIESFYAQNIEEWIEVFGKEIQIVYFEDLISNPSDVILNIHNWIGSKYEQQNSIFEIHNKSNMPNNVMLHKIAIYTYSKLEVFFRKNNRLKFFLRNIYERLNVSSNGFELKNKTKKRLMFLFKHQNKLLYEVLDKNNIKKPNWNNSL